MSNGLRLSRSSKEFVINIRALDLLFAGFFLALSVCIRSGASVAHSLKKKIRIFFFFAFTSIYAKSNISTLQIVQLFAYTKQFSHTHSSLATFLHIRRCSVLSRVIILLFHFIFFYLIFTLKSVAGFVAFGTFIFTIFSYHQNTPSAYI